MTSIMYMPDRRPWHRRALSRLRRDLQRKWNKFIYQPYKALTRTLVRWVYGLRPPLVAHSQSSVNQLAAPAPLPLIRNRRLSITSSSSPEEPTISPRFRKKIIGRCNQEQYTATQEQCPLFTKLPLELRLLIYRFALGDLTLHIIPSHVPSLTLPPRFSLRTHPFHRRLDFEVCNFAQRHKQANKEDAVNVLENPEICTREASKRLEIGSLIQLHYKAGTEDAVAWPTSMDYLLTKYGRKGGPLALLKTCRVIYSEAIETLYITNTFCFSDSATLIEFPRTLLPTRVPLLRHLVLHFDFRNQKLGTWLQTCALLRTFPCLQTLTITFLLPEVRSYIDWENESIFSPLVGVSVKGEFVVYVDWLETERDREVAADACFMIVRRKNVEVDEERTRERIRVPHVRSNNSSMWVLRDDGPSDPDGV